MDYLYSLYDALVSINVPTDKARAVVDAMERDMGTTLATKADLDTSQLLLKQELAALRREFDTQFESMRRENATEFASVRREMTLGFTSVREGVSRDLELLRTSMTVRLGSITVVGLGVLFAALRLT
jgi:FKBP-type peptidyl-prolyl cis-trans isomerase (trigger factor)